MGYVREDFLSDPEPKVPYWAREGRVQRIRVFLLFGHCCRQRPGFGLESEKAVKDLLVRELSDPEKFVLVSVVSRRHGRKWKILPHQARNEIWLVVHRNLLEPIDLSYEKQVLVAQGGLLSMQFTSGPFLKQRARPPRQEKEKDVEEEEEQGSGIEFCDYRTDSEDGFYGRSAAVLCLNSAV